MESTPKINVVLGCILIVAILGGGFFVYRSMRTNTHNSIYTNTPTTNQSPTNTQNEPTLPPFEQAIDNTVLRNLSMIKKGILTSSVLTNTYSGTLVRISTAGGYLPSANNFKFKVMIILKSTQGVENSFYYNDREAALIQSELTTLKTNDFVTITETIDLQKNQTENMIALSVAKK